MAATTRILFAEPGLTLAVSGNVSVSVVRAPLTLERVRRLRREGELLLQERGGRGRVSITIVEPPAMVSPDELGVRPLARRRHVDGAGRRGARRPLTGETIRTRR